VKHPSVLSLFGRTSILVVRRRCVASYGTVASNRRSIRSGNDQLHLVSLWTQCLPLRIVIVMWESNARTLLGNKDRLVAFAFLILFQQIITTRRILQEQSISTKWLLLSQSQLFSYALADDDHDALVPDAKGAVCGAPAASPSLSFDAGNDVVHTAKIAFDQKYDCTTILLVGALDASTDELVVALQQPANAPDDSSLRSLHSILFFQWRWWWPSRRSTAPTLDASRVEQTWPLLGTVLHRPDSIGGIQ